MIREDKNGVEVPLQQINQTTSVRAILEEHPDSINVFLKYSAEVPSESYERFLHKQVTVGDSMCLVSDLDALVRDLQQLVAAISLSGTDECYEEKVRLASTYALRSTG